MPFNEDGSYRSLLRYAALVSVMFIFVLFYLWQSIEVKKLSLECDRLIRENRELLLHRDLLSARKEQIKDPAKIDEYAKANGMHRAMPGEKGIIDRLYKK